MTKLRIVVAGLLVIAALLAAAYVAWGDWDRERLIGVSAQPVSGVEDQRSAFAAALEKRFTDLTPAQHDETCDSLRAVGMEDSLAFIRERHYTQPGGPRMPFFDDLAADILARECLIVQV